jgi:hypothetical protein
MTGPPIVIVEDSREQWHPVDVDKSLSIHGYFWTDDTWQLNGEPVDNLSFPEGFEHPTGMSDVGYIETSFGEHLSWTRFHLWLMNNPGPPAFQGHGAHQGDWEMVQIGTDKHTNTDPITVILSQHSSAQKRDWWHSGNEIGYYADGSWFIKVYMALGSHALYFQPGERLGSGDVCDGLGRQIAPSWEFPGFWWNWPGRWGIDGPKSPGEQRGTPDDFSAKLDR